MKKYSIRELEQLSGVNMRTIRVWERRYGLLKPFRTDTNIRFYDDEQLRRLLNVSQLVNHGARISEVSRMTDTEMAQSIEQLYGETQTQLPQADDWVKALVSAMLDMNEKAFDKVFSASVLRQGFEHTITKVIYPFLFRVGMMWALDRVNPAREHFTSNLIRQKIYAATDSLPVPQNTGGRVVLFLRQHEQHEIGLLLANYLLRARGRNTIFLGSSVPFSDLADVHDFLNPSAMVTSFTVPFEEGTCFDYLKKLSDSFPGTRIVAMGSSFLKPVENMPPGVVWLDNPSDLTDLFH